MAIRLHQRLVSSKIIALRPHVSAAIPRGDADEGMESEGDPSTATLEQAMYWQQIYGEIVVMEEAVLSRIRKVMADQSPQARHEVALSNLPGVVRQLARFKRRRGYWDKQLQELWNKHRSDLYGDFADPSVSSSAHNRRPSRPH